MTNKISEEELYDPVKKWLEEKKYEVFAEVMPPYTSKRADVVGWNKPALSIVELKTTLNLELLDQAFHWKRYAHYIYVAIPQRKKRVPQIIVNFLKQHKIGLLEVNLRYQTVYQRFPARFNRPLLDKKEINWEDELLPEHQTWTKGGTASGGYVTGYKLTIYRVKDMLQQSSRRGDGWMTMREILNKCETHYAHPKSSLAQALRLFEDNWCEVKKENGKLWFRYNAENDKRSI